jgi:glutathione S-transferase
MLELYHWEPNAESLALLICLKEKGLEFNSQYVDMMKLEHHSADYQAKSPKSIVPLLEDEGERMDDTHFALQYLDERYPEPRLAPDDAAQLYDVQAWAAWLGGAMGGIGTDVRLLGWNLVMLNAIPKNELAEFRKRVAALPKQLQSGWSAVWSDAEASEDQLANARERIQKIIGRIEQALADTGWIVGYDYSITDITAFAYIHTLPELLPEMVNRETTPNIVKWLEAINSRPAVRYALALRKSTIAKDVYPAPGT